MTLEDWKKQIAADAAKRPAPIVAKTFLNKLQSSISRAFVVKGEDGKKYAVKGMQDRTGAGAFDIRRPLCNDQIVGRLGRKIGVPVPDVVFIELTKEFIDANPPINYMYPGVCHGQLLMENCSNKEGVKHADVVDNRQRFAAIAVLYGWIPAGDRQLIYEKTPPYLVYSVDHGHFFPGGPDWTAATLKTAPPPGLFPEVVTACKFAVGEIDAAMKEFEKLLSADIAAAAAMPIDLWGLSPDERAELAVYLDERRTALIAAKPKP